MFTASSKSTASPEQVLQVLIDPDAIHLVAGPVRGSGLRGSRLEVGTRTESYPNEP